MPVVVEALRKWDDVVTSEQALVALCGALPKWKPMSVPLLLHFVKLWGVNADFSIAGLDWSGRQMVETLLNDRICRERTNPLGAHYLLDSPYGTHIVRLGTHDSSETRGESHFGQLLKALAQSGVPTTLTVQSESGRLTTVKHILQDAEYRFSWAEELDFISCALALYIPPAKTWHDQFSNEYSFDALVEHLLNRQIGAGACGGSHLPYALVVILRVDEQSSIIAPRTRRRAIDWLCNLALLLDRTQLADGGWDRTWSANGRVDVIARDDLMDRTTITGHHLEWMALAPLDVSIRKATVSRASTAVARDIESLMGRADLNFKIALPSSHAARALCLFRGDDPFSSFRAGFEAGDITLDPVRASISQVE